MKQHIILPVLRRLVRPFIGKGLGRFPLLAKAYTFLYSRLKPRGIALVEVEGSKMYIDVSQIPLSAHLFMAGAYEQDTTALFKRIAKEGMVIVDIGANIGYYTLLAARLVGKRGKVFAFEPDPDNYALLLRNIEANGYQNVVPVNKAVSDNSEPAKLFLDPQNRGTHRLWDSHDERQYIEVEVTTLDEFFRSLDISIDIIKMDIEGCEPRALAGMNNLIMRNPNLRIISEFWPEGIKGSGFSPAEFLQHIVECGFRLYHITNNGGIQPTDAARLMNICEDKARKGYPHLTNIYCERG